MQASFELIWARPFNARIVVQAYIESFAEALHFQNVLE